MAVEDAELLALAGGDSSDDETPRQSSSKQRNATSPLPSIEVSRASGRKRRLTSGADRASRRRRSPAYGDSEEEGEARSSSRGSPDSLQSAPMSESSSDSSSPGADAASDDNPYPLENKFASESDKKRILALPEVEREAILADRAQVMERRIQDQHLRRLLQVRENAEAKFAKRKSAASELDDSPRKSSRQKTALGGRKVGQASKTIEEYKRQRQEKGIRDQQRRAGAAARAEARRRNSSEGLYSTSDDAGESEVEWDDGKGKDDQARLRDAQPADYNDFRRTTLTRFFLAEFCFHPGFEEKVKNCYLRLPQKSAPGQSSNGYQLVQIKGVFEKEGWPYALIKESGKRIVTTQHLVLAVEGTQKEFHMACASNSIPTEVEVANYKAHLSDEGKNIPSHSYLESKIDDINAIIHHQFTDEELQKKLSRSGVLQTKTISLNRITIMNKRKQVEEQGDEAAIAKCNAELAELAGPKLRYGTTLEEPARAAAPSTPSQQERLAELNRINRRKNAEEVRKAQLAEKRAARLARQAVERGEAVQDPFARVKTTAKTHYDVNETLAPHRAKQQALSREASRSATPSGMGTPKLGPKKPLQPVSSPEAKATAKTLGLPGLGNRCSEEDFISQMNLDIDIEI